MTDADKLNRLKKLLQEKTTDEDDLLSEYLDMSKDEILNWLYIRSGAVPATVTSVPARYEQVQIMAVVSAYNIIGGEGQSEHTENGFRRVFKYEDLLAYIHSHVYPYVE